MGAYLKKAAIRGSIPAMLVFMFQLMKHCEKAVICLLLICVGIAYACVTYMVVVCLPFAFVACGNSTDNTESQTEESIKETYYEAGGDYYGAEGDEAVQIEKNEDGSVNVYWIKGFYDNGEIMEYSILAMAENIPSSTFANEKYIVLIGKNECDTYYIYFEDDFTMCVEGNMWVFERGDEQIDISEIVKIHKEANKTINYNYLSYIEDVAIVEGDISEFVISFYKKWYKQYENFSGEVGLLELKGDETIEITINGKNYKSFNENDFSAGDTYDYLKYTCTDGTEFEYYPEYEASLTGISDIRPVIRFNERKCLVSG